MFFLLDRENNKTQALFPSHRRLADDTGLSERSVTRGITTLVKFGYLRIKRKGCPGRATDYQIIYDSLSVDRFVQNGRQICPKQSPDLSDQLTNKLTNELTNQEGVTDLSSNRDEREKVQKILSSITKNMNFNYRSVVEGKKLKYHDPESIRRRYVEKTGKYQDSFEFKKMLENPKTKHEALEIAKHLGIVKEFKKK